MSYHQNHAVVDQCKVNGMYLTTDQIEAKVQEGKSLERLERSALIIRYLIQEWNDRHPEAILGEPNADGWWIINDEPRIRSAGAPITRNPEAGSGGPKFSLRLRLKDGAESRMRLERFNGERLIGVNARTTQSMEVDLAEVLSILVLNNPDE